MNFDALVDKSVKLLQDLTGEVVESALESAKGLLRKNIIAVALAAAGMVLALVFAAIGLSRWLDLVVDAGHRWAPPFIVAGACALIGLVALKSMGGAAHPKE